MTKPQGDAFARATAMEAHRRATDALTTAQQLRSAAERIEEMFNGNRIVGRCPLCGQPSVRGYCHEHDWAA